MTTGIAQKRPHIASLYAADFPGWAQQQGRAIREGCWSEIDWDNVAEEIESLGRNDRRALESHLEVLIAHLLKWAIQPERRTPSWEYTITAQREQIARLIKRSPSLRRWPAEHFGAAYPPAVRLAARDTGLPESELPSSCPFTLEQVLADEFLPD